jgi:hypothetical protein
MQLPQKPHCRCPRRREPGGELLHADEGLVIELAGKSETPVRFEISWRGFETARQPT